MNEVGDEIKILNAATIATIIKRNNDGTVIVQLENGSYVTAEAIVVYRLVQ